MPEDRIVQLMSRAGFSFVGTIERLGASAVEGVPVGERTAVVKVEKVLHAPPAFWQLAGSLVTVELAPEAGVPQVGDRLALFADGTVLGESLAVREVARLPAEEVEAELTAASRGVEEGGPDIHQQVRDVVLRSHAEEADAAVVARVTRLEKAGPHRAAEHDPDWWRATLDVFHVEKGDVQPGELVVVYANSLDVRWRSCPKPKAGQEGLWLLHRTGPELRELADFQLSDSLDFQPVERADVLRPAGGA